MGTADGRLVLEKSPRHYALAKLEDLGTLSPDDLDALTWPATMEPLPCPVVERAESGGRALSSYPMEKACLDALHEVEPLCTSKRFAEARAQYSQIRERFSKCYMATVFLADEPQV